MAALPRLMAATYMPLIMHGERREVVFRDLIWGSLGVTMATVWVPWLMPMHPCRVAHHGWRKACRTIHQFGLVDWAATSINFAGFLIGGICYALER